MELLNILFRTVFFYFFILFSYRLMGKREIGQLGVIDLIVSILIAELAVISIENSDKSMIFTILPIAVLVILEIILGLVSIKSKKLRTIFGGKPTLIISKGKINYKELVKQRYALDDLLVQLRQKSIKSLEDVEYAFLEPDGKLSIFKYNIFKTKSDYPIPIIIDGRIQETTLKQIKKTKTWLLDKISEKNIPLSEIFYAFYHCHGMYIIKKSEIV